jgi:Cancer susceptibility candidate 1 N-terminus
MLDDYKGLIENHCQDLKQINVDFLNEMEWKDYLKCKVLPNPKSERDLNTFLILWEEEKLVFDNIPSLTSLYDQLPTCTSLLEELEAEKAKLLDDKAQMIQNYISRLSQILVKKCDTTTYQILQKIHLFPRESTENVQIEKSENDFKFGLWTNLTKNPKYILFNEGINQ